MLKTDVYGLYLFVCKGQGLHIKTSREVDIKN